jgi:hypothetical protein
MAFNPFATPMEASFSEEIERLEGQGQKNADALAQQPHCIGESQPLFGLAALCHKETARGRAGLSFDAWLFSGAANLGYCNKGVSTQLRTALAAFLRQVGQKLTHALYVDGVPNVPTLAGRAQQSRPIQLLEMERRVGGAKAYLIGNLARVDPRGTLLHQQAKDAQAVLMRQCRKRGDNLCFCHGAIFQGLLYQSSLNLLGL